MPPAWQKREQEQQKFVEMFLLRINAEAETYTEPDQFRTELAMFILIELFSENSYWRHLRLSGDFPETRSLLAEFYEEAGRFVRVESEVAVLVKRLFDALVPDAFFRSLRPYESERVLDPRKVYGTDRATDEVAL